MYERGYINGFDFLFKKHLDFYKLYSIFEYGIRILNLPLHPADGGARRY